MPVLALVSLIAAAAAMPSVAAAHPGMTRDGQQSFEQRCLPLPNGWRRQGCEFGELATVNLLEVRRERLVWNGRAISLKTLQSYLRQTHRLSPRPGIALVVDAASSKRKAAIIRQTIEARVGCKLENVCVEYTAFEWKRAQPPAGREVG
jgi:hypothetical protein